MKIPSYIRYGGIFIYGKCNEIIEKHLNSRRKYNYFKVMHNIFSVVSGFLNMFGKAWNIWNNLFGGGCFCNSRHIGNKVQRDKACSRRGK